MLIFRPESSEETEERETEKEKLGNHHHLPVAGMRLLLTEPTGGLGGMLWILIVQPCAFSPALLYFKPCLGTALSLIQFIKHCQKIQKYTSAFI